MSYLEGILFIDEEEQYKSMWCWKQGWKNNKTCDDKDCTCECHEDDL